MKYVKLFEDFDSDIDSLFDDEINIEELSNNCVPEVSEYDGDKSNGWSVLVKDRNSDIREWMDVYIDDGDLHVDWNKYIFSKTDPDDILSKAIQADVNIFELFTNAASSFLENEGVIYQLDNGDYKANNSVIVNK